jgi:hypothetical protein
MLISGIMYKPGARSERACKELCVIRSLILVLLEHLPILAAGLVTAFFIFPELEPLGYRRAPANRAGLELRLPPVLSARILERALLVW